METAIIRRNLLHAAMRVEAQIRALSGIIPAEELLQLEAELSRLRSLL